jgi:hypothetical protein
VLDFKEYKMDFLWKVRESHGIGLMEVREFDFWISVGTLPI